MKAFYVTGSKEFFELLEKGKKYDELKSECDKHYADLKHVYNELYDDFEKFRNDAYEEFKQKQIANDECAKTIKELVNENVTLKNQVANQAKTIMEQDAKIEDQRKSIKILADRNNRFYLHLRHVEKTIKGLFNETNS